MAHSSTAENLRTADAVHEVRVPNRFNGPARSGNGGWSAALLGKHLGPEVEVTLRKPIPLDQALEVIVAGRHATLVHGATEIATAREVELDVDIPDAVSFAEAEKARAGFAGYHSHPVPTCFVCGTDRCCGNGMDLFTGPLQTGIVASSWVPESEFATKHGDVRPELVCAALDCPGAWAFIDRYQIDSIVVLGRMTYRLDRPVYAGEPYVVMGWSQGREGRKLGCGTAIYDAEGRVCAAAKATWLELS